MQSTQAKISVKALNKQQNDQIYGKSGFNYKLKYEEIDNVKINMNDNGYDIINSKAKNTYRVNNIDKNSPNICSRPYAYPNCPPNHIQSESSSECEECRVNNNNLTQDHKRIAAHFNRNANDGINQQYGLAWHKNKSPKNGSPSFKESRSSTDNKRSLSNNKNISEQGSQGRSIQRRGRRRKIFQKKIIKATVIQPQNYSHQRNNNLNQKNYQSYPAFITPQSQEANFVTNQQQYGSQYDTNYANNYQHNNGQTLDRYQQPNRQGTINKMIKNYQRNTKIDNHPSGIHQKIRGHNIQVQDSFQQYYTVKDASERSSQTRPRVPSKDKQRLVAPARPTWAHGQQSPTLIGKYKVQPIYEYKNQDSYQRNTNNVSPSKLNDRYQQSPRTLSRLGAENIPFSPNKSSNNYNRPQSHSQQKPYTLQASVPTIQASALTINSHPQGIPPIKWNYISNTSGKILPRVHVTTVPYIQHVAHAGIIDRNFLDKNIQRQRQSQLNRDKEQRERSPVTKLPSFAKNQLNDNQLNQQSNQKHQPTGMPSFLPQQLYAIKNHLQRHQQQLQSLNQRLKMKQNQNHLRQKQLLSSLICKQGQLNHKQEQLNDNLEKMVRVQQQSGRRYEQVLKCQLEMIRAKRIGDLERQNQKLNQELMKSNQESRQTTDLTPFDHPININNLSNHTNIKSPAEPNLSSAKNQSPYLSLSMSHQNLNHPQYNYKFFKYEQNTKQISAVTPYEYEQFYQQNSSNNDNTLRELLSPLEITPDYDFLN